MIGRAIRVSIAIMTASDWDLAHANLTAEPSRWGTPVLDLGQGADRLGQPRPGPLLRRPGPPAAVALGGDHPGPGAADHRAARRHHFVVIGDTGEQDASQYVVCPSLSAAVREHRPGFVLIASDVIYPAGDVDDYRDGVYRPYRSPDPNFRVDARCSGCRATTTGTTGSPASCTTSPARSGRRRRRTRPRAGGRGPGSAGCPGSCGGAPRRPRPATTALRDADRDPGPQRADPGHGAARALLRDPHQARAGRRHRHRHRRCDGPRAVRLARAGLRAARARRSWSPGSRCWSTAGSTRCWVGAKPKDGTRRLGVGPGQPAAATATWPRSVVTCTTSSSTAAAGRRGRPGAAPGRRRRRGVRPRDPHLRQRRPRLPGAQQPDQPLLRPAGAVVPQPGRVVPPLRRAAGARGGPGAWATCCSSWPEGWPAVSARSWTRGPGLIYSRRPARWPRWSPCPAGAGARRPGPRRPAPRRSPGGW